MSALDVVEKFPRPGEFFFACEHIREDCTPQATSFHGPADLAMGIRFVALCDPCQVVLDLAADRVFPNPLNVMTFVSAHEAPPC